MIKFIGICLVIMQPLFSMESYVPGFINFREYIIIPREDVSFSPLHVAVHNGDIRQTRQLLERGEDITKQLPSGDTVLHMAAIDGHVTLLRLLLEWSQKTVPLIDINTPNKTTKALLTENFILQYPDITYRGKQTPLHKAVRGGVDVVKLLLHYGANVHPQDEENHVPLYYAILEEDPEIILALVEAGATFEEVNQEILPTHFSASFEQFLQEHNFLQRTTIVPLPPPPSRIMPPLETSDSEEEQKTLERESQSPLPRQGVLSRLKDRLFHVLSLSDQ